MTDQRTSGVIYVAQGADYLELALASAGTLVAHNPGLAVDLFTDQAPFPSALFAQVHPIPNIPSLPPKLACLPLSRFDRTLYLDCDTLVVNPFGDLFDILNRFDLALAHDVRRIWGLIREGHLEATPYAFPQHNAGVMLYRQSPAMAAFLADWAARYRAAGRERDQITLKDLLWASDIRFYVLPPEFNLRRVTLMDAWEPLDALPTIIHSHRLLQHLRASGQPRVQSLTDLMALERVALAGEWLALGLEPQTPAGENPAARFTDRPDAE